MNYNRLLKAFAVAVIMLVIFILGFALTIGALAPLSALALMLAHHPAIGIGLLVIGLITVITIGVYKEMERTGD